MLDGGGVRVVLVIVLMTVPAYVVSVGLTGTVKGITDVQSAVD